MCAPGYYDDDDFTCKPCVRSPCTYIFCLGFNSNILTAILASQNGLIAGIVIILVVLVILLFCKNYIMKFAAKHLVKYRETKKMKRLEGKF